MKAQRVLRCSSTLSLTSALHEGGWSAPRPGRFTPGKETRYPFYRGPGGSGRMRKISHPPGFGPRPVRPVASRYSRREKFKYACWQQQQITNHFTKWSRHTHLPVSWTVQRENTGSPHSTLPWTFRFHSDKFSWPVIRWTLLKLEWTFNYTKQLTLATVIMQCIKKRQSGLSYFVMFWILVRSSLTMVTRRNT